MSNELQKSLPKRAKDFLQVEGEHSLFELAELLRQFRNDTHPDRYQDQELKKQAESRFKDAQALLDEFDKHMEVERFNRKPTELTLYKPLYDAVKLQSDLDKTKKELEDTKYELASERESRDALTKELQTKKDDSLNNEIQHLQSIYRPSTRKYASIGLAILLSGALGVMSQMEKVSGVLEKYSPFGKQYISTGLFICLVLFLAAMLRKIWEREYIKRKSEEVCSPKCAGGFMEYLRVTRASDAPIVEFSEVEAFEFIAGDKQRLKSVVTFLGFQIFRRETVNRLKDIFIHSLLNKKLVEISRAEKMQRYFSISSSRASYLWYHEYMLEQEKKKAAAPANAPE
jgi:hypothetical protein